MVNIRSLQTSKYLGLGFLALACAGIWLWLSYFRPGMPDPGSTKLLKDLAVPEDDEDEEDDEVTAVTSNQKKVDETPSKKSNKSTKFDEEVKTPIMSNTSDVKTNGSHSHSSSTDKKLDLSTVHKQIEEIDKRGKVHFKAKEFMEAADAFTEALNLIEETIQSLPSSESQSLSKQVVTLTNNRSAMYEKANLPDLSLHGTYIQYSLTCLFSILTHSIQTSQSMKYFKLSGINYCYLKSS